MRWTERPEQNRNVYKRVVAYDVGCRKTFPSVVCCMYHFVSANLCDVSTRDRVRMEVRANKHSTEMYVHQFSQQRFSTAWSLFHVPSVCVCVQCAAYRNGLHTRCQVTVIQFCWYTRRKSDKKPRRHEENRFNRRTAESSAESASEAMIMCTLFIASSQAGTKWERAVCNAVFVTYLRKS